MKALLRKFNPGIILVILLSCMSFSTTSLASNEQVSKLERIEALIQKNTAQALLQHHQELLDNQDTNTVAAELLSLTHGPAWQIDSSTYLSVWQMHPKGKHVFPNAFKLGQWVGSMRLALETENMNAAKASLWLESLLDNRELLLEHGPDELQNTERYRALVSEVKQSTLSVTKALELLTYNDVNASTLTSAIGMGITEIEQQIAP